MQSLLQKITFYFFLFLFLIWGFPGLQAQSPISYVNPFVGSSNFGATNPGAVAPQGMVSVTPFNVTGSASNKFDKDARWWSMPYVQENSFCTGYTHVNLSGVGCPELGVILVMPTTGEVTANHRKYGSGYTRQKASPGYYSQKLTKYNILTEATATQRAGMSKFTFPKGKSNILINLGVGLTNETGASLRIVNDQEIEGMRMTGSFCYHDGSERPVFFVARMSKPAKKSGVWKKMPPMKAEKDFSKTSNAFKYYENYRNTLAGDSIGAWMTFDTDESETIVVKVGVSYVSIENARENLDAEMAGFDFGETRKQAESTWSDWLSRIQVEGGTEEQKHVFYTALYHIHLHPNVLNDVNGEYPKMESHEIGKVTGRNRYTVFSLWDTYRNYHPFMSLVYPEQQLDMVRSMVDMYKESGWLPKWELNSQETHVMDGDPALPVIADTYLRGLKDFDVDAAYQGMVKSASSPGKENMMRPDNDDYLDLGYVPLKEKFDFSVSHALEYYVADWNLAQLAKALGRTSDYYRFEKQSMRYVEYFDSTKFMMIRPRLEDGNFYEPFDPKQGENFEPVPGFHEGNAYQYSFYVPHDIPGLIKLNGGPGPFVKTLQKIFDEKLFDMANEPDINYPYLFNYVSGEEWRTQKEVRRLIDTYYKNTPDGIPGNDDCGVLSAWVVFSMMGIYPVCPGNMDFAISTPVFDKVTLQLDPKFYPGKELIIEAKRKTISSNSIQKIKWNGKRWDRFFIPHQELVKGGKLEVTVDGRR